MVAIDWRYIAILVAELFVTALGMYGLNKVRKIRTPVWRIAGLLLCGLVSLLGSLATVAFLGLSGCNSHSALVYCPSGKVAARTNDFDSGALGGDTSVTLHWAHGFRSQTVYWGGWKSVEAS